MIVSIGDSIGGADWMDGTLFSLFSFPSSVSVPVSRENERACVRACVVGDTSIGGGSSSGGGGCLTLSLSLSLTRARQW